MNRFHPAAIAALALALPAAQAEGVPPIVVTASRLPSPISPPRSLSAGQLAAHDSAADALARLPDLHIIQPGGRSGFAAPSLRGADPNFTLVLLDGIPLNNATSSRGGAVNLAELSLAGVDRIEIATGPRSPTLGSGALAGVINLTVPGGTSEPELTATAGIGTREDRMASVVLRGPLPGGLGGTLVTEYSNDGEASPDAAFESFSAMARVAPLQDASRGRLLVRYNRVRSRQYPDASGGSRFARLRGTEVRGSDEWVTGISHRTVDAGRFHLDVGATMLNRVDTVESPGVAATARDPVGLPGGVDHGLYRRLVGQVAAGLQAEGFDLVAGAEAQHERGRNEGVLRFAGFELPARFAAQRTSIGTFAEASARRGGWQADVGGRFDAISGLKTRLSGRAALAHHFDAAGVTVSASHGSSFKAPSFYALGNPFVGNPELRPERARTTEASIEWKAPSGTHLTLTVFDSRFSDLIDFVAEPSPKLVNRARVRSRGASIALERPLGDRLDVTTSLTHADTADEDTRARLRNRPAWRATASLRWRPREALTLSARVSHVGGQLDFAVPVGSEMLPSYEVYALDAEWRPRGNVTVRAVLDNALDAHYADAIGFSSPGRRARLLVSHRF